ncbi:MAG TPA: glycosyltransferase family 39 protein [Elusimicrobiota bacterium]|nr:glycosyltransferase family 39 protein [Elusimicrobiota bacterium]
MKTDALNTRRQEAQGRLGALAAGLFFALWGIRWGLPERANAGKAFPGASTSSPQFVQDLTKSRKRLYKNIWLSHKDMAQQEPVTYVKGVAVIPPGWTYPPPDLLNSYRSFLLQSEDPDEKKSFIILSQMRPWKLDFEPLYVVYGGAFIYPLGAFLAFSSAVRAVHLVHGLSYYLAHPGEMARLYLCGRVFMTIFQLLTIWMLYDIGCLLSGWKTGLLASFLFLLTPAVAVNSHILKPHPCAAFWCLAALRYGLAALQSGARRDYWLCGLAVGMASGTEFSMACFAVVPALAWMMGSGGRSAGGRRREFFLAAQAIFGAAFLCLAANPYLLLAYRDFAWELTIYVGHGSSGFSYSLAAVARGWASGLGYALSLVMAGAIAAALVKGGKERRFVVFSSAIVFLSLWIAFTKLWGFANSPFVLRYYYALIGPMCVLAADWLANGLPSIAGPALIGIVLLESGVHSLVYYRNMALDSGPSSTRLSAAAWVDSHVPRGASVGLLNYPEPAHTPPFPYSRYRLVIFNKPSALSPREEPRYMVLDEEGRASMRSWLARRYTEIKTFPSWGILGFKADDASFYANAGIYVYRKSPAPSRKS